MCLRRGSFNPIASTIEHSSRRPPHLIKTRRQQSGDHRYLCDVTLWIGTVEKNYPALITRGNDVRHKEPDSRSTNVTVSELRLKASCGIPQCQRISL
ncbi:unnamed protein product [Dicrocoelium dendriticum]|nr:unnamed protein product [Dicrocoelium dendriticum]